MDVRAVAVVVDVAVARYYLGRHDEEGEGEGEGADLDVGRARLPEPGRRGPGAREVGDRGPRPQVERTAQQRPNRKRADLAVTVSCYRKNKNDWTLT